MDTAASETAIQAEATPWHLYAVGSLVLVWGILCVARYLAFQHDMLDPQMVAGLQLEVFYDLPLAVMAAWALCTWGGVAGAAMLLARSKWAVQAFTLSLVGLIVTSFYQYAMTANPVSIYDMPVNLAVWIIALVALLYASRAQSVGVLR